MPRLVHPPKLSHGLHQPLSIADSRLPPSFSSLPKPATKELRCIEVEEQPDVYRTAYSEAWWRVLWYNPPRVASVGDANAHRLVNAHSLLGKEGHIERSNVFTHLAAALVFAVYAVARRAFVQNKTISSDLAQAVVLSGAITFWVSTIYHTQSGTLSVQPWFRVLDHTSIVMTLSLSNTADLALSMATFENESYHTFLDPVLAFVAAVMLFIVIRVSNSIDETTWAGGSCPLGLFQIHQSDGAFKHARPQAYLCLALYFVLHQGVAFERLRLAAVALVVQIVSFVLLLSGMLLDNVVQFPDRQFPLYASTDRKPCWYGLLHSKRCGCVCHSHAMWHVLAFVSAAVLVLGRDLILNDVG